MTKQEVKVNIVHKIMELRNKDLIEEDSILDVLDDNLDPYITELEDNLDQERETRGCIETDYNTYKSEATEIIKFLINPQLLDKPQYYEWRLKAEKFIKG
jgi:hypothetical protein